MRVVFMGTPDFAVPALRAVAARHEVCAVYCQPPRPAGRGQADRKSPVQAAAEALGLPVSHPATFRDPADIAAFAALGAEVAVVVAYGLILPAPLLSAPAMGCLNIHASLLPRWRGAAPIHRAVMAGDRETGISIMQMDEGLDTGPVLLRQALPIGPEETTADLHDRLAALGAQLILSALDGIRFVPRTPQPAEGVTYAAKIAKAEARIDWTRPADEIDRQIRGLSPFPGAWCMAGGERLKLLRSRLAPGLGQPGQVLSGLTVACGAGAVEILAAQREGKRPVAAEELLRGLTLPERLA
ncbi:MAG: methionyl-tRNA formyltransferase [Proteobacteria bacterium]|nr:methionyl-tRNA formyltransferase [Pseudomonadota bacterium]MBS0574548.1 methionyl-tRNA formyltransferase [Pseudomonadota bacterium]